MSLPKEELWKVLVETVHALPMYKNHKRYVHRIGGPTTAKELGIGQEYIVEALTKAHSIRPERYTILGESGLTKEAAQRVASITGVID